MDRAIRTSGGLLRTHGWRQPDSEETSTTTYEVFVYLMMPGHRELELEAMPSFLPVVSAAAAMTPKDFLSGI